jgi:hypothetical protein
MGTSTTGKNDSIVVSALTVQTSQAGGFDMAQHTVAPSDLQAAATQEGAQSRVITAVSFDAGEVFYLSYGWQSDTSTVYETLVETASFDTLTSVASNLAAAGYIITAMGGNATDGILLVGTRVRGDTTGRPILIVPLGGDLTPLSKGYAVVGLAYQYNASSQLIANPWIGER